MMSIKSDRWIRRLAKTGMIEPFEQAQVRTQEGRKIVSYGTSSYGYDVRCAREFKIFTNINSTIIDPKQFDVNNFVDFNGDVCIVPPNSFALARTVEYFRIPRNVLTVCLGMIQMAPSKSTKFFGSKFFGSMIVELMLVKILNSPAQRTS
jgi:dCTP deaminase